jgi:dCTP deaminase
VALCDRTIRAAFDDGLLGEMDLEDIQFQPASLDMTLGNEFFVFERPLGLVGQVSGIDPEKPFDESWGRRVTVGDQFAIGCGDFVLATTRERIRIPTTWIARVEGRSSLARVGLVVHATAGFIDPGFVGQITLEMTNLNPRPIILRPGMRICQLSFDELDQCPARPYGSPELRSKYNNQSGVTTSRLHLDRAEGK